MSRRRRDSEFILDGREYAAEMHQQDTTPLSSPPCEAYPFEFSKDVSANVSRDSPETVTREVPYDGWVTELVVGWSQNANNAVGVQFRRRSGEVFFPRNKEDHYIGQDNFQHPYTLCAPISEGEQLVAQFINTDTSNSHFTNVIPTLQKAPPGWG